MEEKILEKLVLIDGNNILNRAFYGIMGSKMLMTNDGKYTNAVYGFLAILFKILDELNPEYLVVTFDLKAPTARHKMYEGYKANRKGMPNELAEQMPIIKEVLRAMNIDIVEKEGYEADDIMGTLSRYGEKQGLDVIIVSGDRDTFQLATDKTTIKIPRTKAGKTETEDFDRNKVIETYGLEPKQLIEVKGDTSDNIPGVPGIGEKTAISLIKKYETIDNLYKMVEEGTDDLKGKQREKIVDNKELAYMSRTLGTINLEVPIEDNLEDFKVEEWDKEKVLQLFKDLNFKRFIERFNLNDEKQELTKKIEDLFTIKEITDTKNLTNTIIENKKLIYYFTTQEISDEEKIIKEKINCIYIYNEKQNEVYYVKESASNFNGFLKEIFENKEIEKYGFKQTRDYILLKQIGINTNNIKFDIEVAAYILNSTNNKYNIEDLSKEYLNLDFENYLSTDEQNNQKQLNLFDTQAEVEDTNQSEINKNALNTYCIQKLVTELKTKLKETNTLDLFENIDGKICEGSSVVYKGVADGEYVVGLSWEDPCAQLVKDGAPVEIVYPEEGTVFLPASATIIKGAKNMDNAKLFIDFILSEEVQNIWGSTLTNRPVMKDAATSESMIPMSEINIIEEDIPYVSTHKQEIVDRYTEIFTDLMSR